MKAPPYEEAQRCLEIRKRSKRYGDYVPENIKFCGKMLEKYPEWYQATEEEVFNDTVPAGSTVKWADFHKPEDNKL